MDGYAVAAAAVATGYLFLVVWGAVVGAAGGRRWTPWAAASSQQEQTQQCHASAGGGGRGVLLVVMAHPDDEAMFMTPCLAVLAAEYEAVHFLSLSAGGAYGLGAIRTQELRRSWSFFFGGDQQRSCGRSPAACVRVVEHARLQDGLHTVWDEAHAASVVRRHIADLVADEPSGATRVGLLTFDEAGVSGHPNHAATHRAVRTAAAAEAVDASRAYELVVQYVVSVPRVLKFSGAAGATLSMRGTEGSEVARTFRVWNPLVCLRAMLCHWSQMVWYRWLFIAFSRYTFAVDVVATRHPVGERSLKALHVSPYF